ncbi:MAG: hypothetical protein KF812_03180, partial [Fimbriimonadaceae bacterium]|nr:hypothetical protein [Fimbriimonadaceae bacterium]
HMAVLGISVAMAVAGMGMGWALYKSKLPDKEGFDEKKWTPFFRASNKQFGIDMVLADGSVKTGGVIGGVIRWLDEKVVDGLVNLTGSLTKDVFGRFSTMFQTGFVRGYALVLQVGVILVLIAMVWAAARAGGSL